MIVGTLTTDVLVSGNTPNLIYLEMCFVYIYREFTNKENCPKRRGTKGSQNRRSPTGLSLTTRMGIRRTHSGKNGV